MTALFRALCASARCYGLRVPAKLGAVAALLAALGAVPAAHPAHAERSDRDQPVNIESDRMSADEARKTAVFEGRVVLTRGTMVIRAERLSIRQDKDGFQYGVAAGNLATFRQKREGSDDYIDAEAERIEYDSRSERVQFFERARLRREAGDDVRGNYISYDSRTSYFTVQSAQDAAPERTDSRVRMTIMPKRRTSDSNEPPESQAAPAAGEPPAR